MDLVATSDRLPSAGETVMGRTFAQNPGGKGANQAVAAARAGAKTYFVGAVGKDQYGEELLRSLRDAGVDVRHTDAVEDAPTGVALIVVDVEGRNQITVVPGANSRVSLADRFDIDRLFAPGSVVVLQLEIPLETVSAVAHRARRSGALVILNPAPAVPLPDDLLSSIDILVPNELEVWQLSPLSHPSDTLDRVAEELRALGVGSVVITLGASGSRVIDGRGSTEIASHAVRAIDTTAGGDAFVGAMAARLCRGDSLRRAAEFGNAAGALSVQKQGAQPSIPLRAEIEALLEESGRT